MDLINSEAKRWNMQINLSAFLNKYTGTYLEQKSDCGEVQYQRLYLELFKLAILTCFFNYYVQLRTKVFAYGQYLVPEPAFMGWFWAF